MAKRVESLDEILGQFSARIDQTVRVPNIYRYEPMPHQELFHMSCEKGRILFGGNRAGKTYSGGADDVMILLRRHPHRSHLYPATGPIRMRFIGVDFDRGIDQTAVPLFAELIPPSFLINGSWEDSYSRGEHMLRLDDKSTVSFMSYEQHPNKFQAVSLHHIHFDEEPPKAIFDESMLRLIDTGGSWTLSETPVMQLEWIQDELIEKSESGERPDIAVFYLDTRDNKHLPVAELQLLEKNLTEEEKIVRLQGRYKGGSLVFPEFEKRPPYVIPETEFTLTPEWAVYESMDYGYANPTAWLWTAVHPDGSIITFRSLYAKRVVVSEWCTAVKAVRQQIGQLLGLPPDNDWQPTATVGDPAIAQNNQGTSGITVQQAYALGGIYIGTEGIVAARTGRQNIGLDKMHTYLRLRPASHPRGPLPWWQITESNVDLVTELRKARKPKQTAANEAVKNASEQIRDKDNHAIDGIKYMFIITHDLRPERYRDDAGETSRQLHGAIAIAQPAPVKHRDVYTALVSDTGTAWTVHGGSSDYSSLEE